MSEKIQKVLANAGIGSRREIETWIQDGRVRLNGQIAQIGDRMTYHDNVSVDNREIKLIKSQDRQTRVLLYHKPEGELCTRHDPEGRPTVFDHLPYVRNSRWISVGRLDFNTSGLLILTTDGELANQLMHPRAQLEREYAVRIRGELSLSMQAQLKKGLLLEDGHAKFEKIVDGGGSGSNHWYQVTVTEGRNRLVRRLLEKLDFTVSRLIRIRYGIVYLPQHLRRGKHVELDEDEIHTLMESVADRA
ncbi:MAG TPA: pseudouridine synthase [Gammaproteobacteria bacterium]|jgi:23S rRNA pseudouridine2605 synthase|nr:pseudouridine synthase [Gammaproteobacteria bacterium]